MSEAFVSEVRGLFKRAGDLNEELALIYLRIVELVDEARAGDGGGVQVPPAAPEPPAFFCSNPTCGAEITLGIKEFSEREFQAALCMPCQAVVREKSSGVEP